MPVVSLNVSQIIGKTLIADATVEMWDKAGAAYNNATIIGTFVKGDTIGVVDSYAYGNSPNLYWQIKKVNATTGATMFFFVKHDVNKITLANGKEILKDIEKQKDEQRINEIGAFRFYLEKYFPYIIGIGFVAVALPPILKSLNDGKR